VAYGFRSDLNLSLVTALARTALRLKQRLLPRFSADGLTAGQFDTLKVLYQQGPLCVNDLLEETLTTSGNIDVVLTNLLDKKMISKTPDPADGRRRIIALTAKGRSCIDKSLPGHLDELRQLMSALSISEKQDLEKLLTRLASTL
jgi:MarR family 2-MHQ and catechol resistance regulon transcriptional repressor